MQIHFGGVAPIACKLQMDPLITTEKALSEPLRKDTVINKRPTQNSHVFCGTPRIPCIWLGFPYVWMKSACKSQNDKDGNTDIKTAL